MDHCQIFICNNYVKNIFKKFSNSKKILRKLWTMYKFLFTVIANVF